MLSQGSKLLAFNEIKNSKEKCDPFCSESPEENESLSYKEGHFKNQQETNTINTAALTVTNQGVYTLYLQYLTLVYGTGNGTVKLNKSGFIRKKIKNIQSHNSKCTLKKSTKCYMKLSQYLFCQYHNRLSCMEVSSIMCVTQLNWINSLGINTAYLCHRRHSFSVAQLVEVVFIVN